MACDSVQHVQRLLRLVGEHTGRAVERKTLETLLQPLLDSGLVMREGDHYLSLAIPLGDYVPKRASWGRFRRYLSAGQAQSHLVALMRRVSVVDLPGNAKVAGLELETACAQFLTLGNRKQVRPARQPLERGASRVVGRPDGWLSAVEKAG